MLSTYSASSLEQASVSQEAMAGTYHKHQLYYHSGGLRSRVGSEASIQESITALKVSSGASTLDSKRGHKLSSSSSTLDSNTGGNNNTQPEEEEMHVQHYAEIAHPPSDGGDAHPPRRSPSSSSSSGCSEASHHELQDTSGRGSSSCYEAGPGGATTDATTAPGGGAALWPPLDTADHTPRLPPLTELPWTEAEVTQCLRSGRHPVTLPASVVSWLAWLLQRPLIRLVREMRRFTLHLGGRCSRRDVYSAVKVVFCRSLAAASIQSCQRARALYAASRGGVQQGKSRRAGLALSVGRVQRWVGDTGVRLVTDAAAVALTAALEAVLEETVALGAHVLSDRGQAWNVEDLEEAILGVPELWSIYQPWQHLVCGRTAAGVLCLPSTFELLNPALTTYSDARTRRQHSLIRDLEDCLLTTCVASAAELGELVERGMRYWYNKTPLTSSSRHTKLQLTPLATHQLFHYMRCSQLQGSPSPAFRLESDRPFTSVPPLMDWLRVGATHAEHRGCTLVDDDDIRQAAATLLPGAQVPPRSLDVGCSCEASGEGGQLMQFLRVPGDRLPKLLANNTLNPNAASSEGLTPLMCACLWGDELLARRLLQSEADVGAAVPGGGPRHTAAASVAGWTALHFAAAQGHANLVMLLIEAGAPPDGTSGQETALQVAAAAGWEEVIKVLLGAGADPYRPGPPSLSPIHPPAREEPTCALSLAVQHGHTSITQILLEYDGDVKEYLSLSEILSEGTKPRPIVPSHTCPVSLAASLRMQKHLSKSMETLPESTRSLSVRAELNGTKPINRLDKRQRHKQSLRSLASSCSGGRGTDPVTGELLYMSIDEVYESSRKLRAQETLLGEGNSRKVEALSSALYAAAEAGRLATAVSLSEIGVPWTVHSWSLCLATAFAEDDRKMLTELLDDLRLVRLEDAPSQTKDECLPLLFSLLRYLKHDKLAERICSILSLMFGPEPIPPIKPLAASATTPSLTHPEDFDRSAKFDVRFLVQGKVVGGHRSVLAESSNRFRAMLTGPVTRQDSPCIEISDITHKAFLVVLDYLYSGGVTTDLQIPFAELMNVLEAANFFLLPGLQRHCEICLSQKVTVDTCFQMFKHAKANIARELEQLCECYMLQHLPHLFVSSPGLRRVLQSGHGAGTRLRSALTVQLYARLRDKWRAAKRQHEQQWLEETLGRPGKEQKEEVIVEGDEADEVADQVLEGRVASRSSSRGSGSDGRREREFWRSLSHGSEGWTPGSRGSEAGWVDSMLDSMLQVERGPGALTPTEV